MTVEELERELCTFIRSNIVDSKMDVQPDTAFNTLKIDSLSIVEMVLFIERKFQITIPETELVPDNFKSVKTLAACAIRCLNK
jgi:acyl carrier protein